VSALAAWQRDFMASLEREPDEAARDAPLDHHRAALRARRRDALAATYPLVARLLGEASFDAVAQRHAREHPSRSGNLDLYGDLFAASLARQCGAAIRLADVARLEWACHESLHAADAPALDAAALAALPAKEHGRVRLALHPSVRLVESAYPIAAIREALMHEGDGTLPVTVGERVLVHRVGGEVRVRALADAEYRLLEALLRGATLEEAAAALGDEAAASLAPALARLALEQAIAGFTLAADRA